MDFYLLNQRRTTYVKLFMGAHNCGAGIVVVLKDDLYSMYQLHSDSLGKTIIFEYIFSRNYIF